MGRRVRRSVAFDAAVRAQLAYLVDQGRAEWIGRLREELTELGATISAFPHIGRERDRDRTRILLKVGLPRAPFSVWYAYDEGDPDGPITLIAFFHDRQRERAPRL